jgi:hypothetical protein
VSGGRRFDARAIVSTLNPQQTFQQLVGEAVLPAELAQGVQLWEWEARSMFGLHLGVKGDSPTRRAIRGSATR